MRYTLDSNKHFFEEILTSPFGKLFPWAKPFFLNCERFLIDVDEFYSWAADKARDPESMAQISINTIPFRKFWCEFYKKNTSYTNAKSGITHKYTKSTVFGFGFDLDKDDLYSLVSINDSDRTQLSKDSLSDINHYYTVVEKPYDFIAFLRSQIAVMGFYLQTEYIDAIQKNFRSGSKIKRGKLIKLESKYSIIYRKQPTQITENVNIGSSPVEWSHRWKVRGHWRKIKGTGKDPDGSSIEGHTWVSECVKGPADKPILHKPRIIKDQLPKNFIPIKPLGQKYA